MRSPARKAAVQLSGEMIGSVPWNRSGRLSASVSLPSTYRSMRRPSTTTATEPSLPYCTLVIPPDARRAGRSSTTRRSPIA